MGNLSQPAILSRSCDNGVVEVILDNPPVNALRLDDYAGLSGAITAACQRGADCILLGARGRLFCAGGDLKERVADGAVPDLAEPIALLHTLRRCPVPLITRVQGAAAGVGALIALAGDLIIASPEARFILPEVDTGAIGGYRSLACYLPMPLTRFMSMTGRSVSAAELYEAGIIARLVDAAELDEEACAMAGQVAKRRTFIGDPRALRPSLASW